MPEVLLDPTLTPNTQLSSHFYRRFLPDDKGLLHSGCDSAFLFYNEFPPRNLISAVGFAYDNHLPLTLTPQSFWLSVLRNISEHIGKQPKLLGKLGVSWEGKEVVNVEFPAPFDFENLVDDLVSAASEKVGGSAEVIIPDFSENDKISRACLGVGYLSVYREAFDYRCYTMCGIPKIKISGTGEDWEKISASIDYFKKKSIMSDSYWDKLLLTVSNIMDAFAGKQDVDFWKNIFTRSSMSGVGPCCNGWITDLVYDWEGVGFRSIAKIPQDWGGIDVSWDDRGKRRQLKFEAGVLGIGVDDYGVRPALGFAAYEIYPE